MAKQKSNRYGRLLTAIFQAHYRKGLTKFTFKREEFETAAKKLKIEPIKNLGDLLYTYRYRRPLPEEIASTARKNYEWVIELAGRALYRFRLTKINRICPSPNHYVVKIPDATPELVTMYAMNDEQALLAKVRYNRLVDIFLRVTAYSLQNHLRTTVSGIGQIETDEVYVGVRNTGEQFIIPVQAKGGSDQIGAVQIRQDVEMCRNTFSNLTCRPVAVQFTRDEVDREVIVMFEFCEDGEELKVVDEKHYCLVPKTEISEEDLEVMSRSS